MRWCSCSECWDENPSTVTESTFLRSSSTGSVISASIGAELSELTAFENSLNSFLRNGVGDGGGLSSRILEMLDDGVDGGAGDRPYRDIIGIWWCALGGEPRDRRYLLVKRNKNFMAKPRKSHCSTNLGSDLGGVKAVFEPPHLLSWSMPYVDSPCHGEEETIVGVS